MSFFGGGHAPTASPLSSSFRANLVRAPNDLPGLTDRMSKAGFLAAEEEAEELLSCAAGDGEQLAAMLRRRLTGEPLAWITGRLTFCGIEVRVDAGVYVPRWQSEGLARRALECLPHDGIAIDLCTGSGAIAKTLMVGRPRAWVLACDLDERAIACAAGNGVEVYRGDLFAPLPAALQARADLVVAVVPYVPTGELELLQRDTFTFESRLFYDGGPDGTAVLRRVVGDAPRFLRDGGTLLLELGGDQADVMWPELLRLGYHSIAVLRDEEGDVRGVEAKFTA